MPTIQQFRLPDAGEGLTEAEIISWKVKPGDTVKVNDTIVEIETAKSLVELPSPFAGVVTEILVTEGVTVDVGTPIIAVDVEPGGGASVPPPQAAPSAPAPGSDPSGVQVAPAEGAVEPGLIGGPAPGGRTSVLVGYGPRAAATTRRPRVAPRTDPVAAQPRTTAVPTDPTGAGSTPAAGSVHVLAKPPVRKLARDLGVDLTTVVTGHPGGIITRSDVERAAASSSAGAATSSAVAAPPSETGRTSSSGASPRETRIPVKGVRKATAAAMVASAFTAPHVTEWVQVDVSRTVRLVERLRTDRMFEGVKVSPLLLVAKALLLAVRRNPGVNATWDDAAGEIVVRHYVNLGIAAATPRGLIVPNVKDADRLTPVDLARALADLAATAREGRTSPADQAGGTITITNVGVFGVDGGTPILNPGEAAILAVGQIRRQPWVHKGKVRPRWVTTLALSFDHRLVDGDLGSRFLADVAAVLHDPATAVVW
jgi:pyruvate dehydrogenase E2 component (dihydrolipoamide acetyltransferase)